MFDFLKPKKNKELEGIIARIESNMANNYKDNAQSAFKELEQKVSEMIDGGVLSDRQATEYISKVSFYREKMQGFTHKDQKPYWT